MRLFFIHLRHVACDMGAEMGGHTDPCGWGTPASRSTEHSRRSSDPLSALRSPSTSECRRELYCRVGEVVLVGHRTRDLPVWDTAPQAWPVRPSEAIPHHLGLGPAAANT